MPAQPNSVVRIRKFLHITDRRLFVLYDRVSCERRISIVFLDWNEEKYEFIGNSRRLFSSGEFYIYSWHTSIYNMSYNMFGSKVYNLSNDPTPDEMRDDMLYLWKVNDSASDFELYKTIVVPKFANYFKIIEGKMVFMRTKHKTDYQICGLDQIDSIVLCNEDGTLTTLNNTEIHLDCLRHQNNFMNGLNVSLSTVH